MMGLKAKRRLKKFERQIIVIDYASIMNEMARSEYNEFISED